MSVYNIDGNNLSTLYNKNGQSIMSAYNVDGNVVFPGEVDYTNYSYVTQWASKGISPAQGFDIYDDKVFWINKEGNSSASAKMYVFNLSDGSQALDTAYVTADTWHGNSIAIDYPLMYASAAYLPSEVFVNTFAQDYSATMSYKLIIDDNSRNCDVCLDPDDNNIMWTLGHSADSSNLSAPFIISKWDLSDLTDNGDGTYTPNLLQTVTTPQPSTSFYFQECRIHDGIMWYCSGNGSGPSYVYGVSPTTGERLYTIDLQTSTEPEGLVFYPDSNAPGGFALYVGFQGMALRKYTFAPAN